MVWNGGDYNFKPGTAFHWPGFDDGELAPMAARTLLTPPLCPQTSASGGGDGGSKVFKSNRSTDLRDDAAKRLAAALSANT